MKEDIKAAKQEEKTEIVNIRHTLFRVNRGEGYTGWDHTDTLRLRALEEAVKLIDQLISALAQEEVFRIVVCDRYPQLSLEQFKAWQFAEKKTSAAWIAARERGMM